MSTAAPLEETMAKFPLFTPDDNGKLTAPLADFQKCASHIDLTTSLPFMYQATKRMRAALAPKCSEPVLESIGKALQQAVVAMATVSACQLLERGDSEEA
eukprot:13142785-Alexandrium_andersonii.AAC.1